MSETPETVEVRTDELFEIEKLLSHPKRRLNEDKRYNDDRENRMRSEKGEGQLEEAVERLRGLRAPERYGEGE